MVDNLEAAPPGNCLCDFVVNILNECTSMAKLRRAAYQYLYCTCAINNLFNFQFHSFWTSLMLSPGMWSSFFFLLSATPYAESWDLVFFVYIFCCIVLCMFCLSSAGYLTINFETKEILILFPSPS